MNEPVEILLNPTELCVLLGKFKENNAELCLEFKVLFAHISNYF